MLVQASQYYKFAATVLLAMGLVFQVPVAILAATRAGIVTPQAAAEEPPLRDRGVRGRRRAAARGRVTLLLETVPLYLLYEASILLASLVERSRGRRPQSAVDASGRREHSEAPGIPRADPAPYPRRRSGAKRAGDDRPRRQRASD